MGWNPILKALVEAPSWRECQFIVEKYPEVVMVPTYEEELSRYITLASTQDPRGARIAEEVRAILQRCREVGVEQAFYEKVNGVLECDFGRVQSYPDYFSEAELLRFFTALRDGNWDDVGRLFEQMGKRSIGLTAFLTDTGGNIRRALDQFPSLSAVFNADELERGRETLHTIANVPGDGRIARF